MKKLKEGDKVCWSFGGRNSQFYPKKNKLCGKLKDLSPSIAPSSYKVQLNQESINLLKKLDQVKRVNPIIYPMKEAVKKTQ